MSEDDAYGGLERGLSGQLFDREGNEISMERWAMLFEDKRYQVLKQTLVGDVQVSTVWLGIDHSFGMAGKPVIFESMIFEYGVQKRLSVDNEQYRYQTEDEALRHHDQLVEQVRLIEGADLDRTGTSGRDADQAHHGVEGDAE